MVTQWKRSCCGKRRGFTLIELLLVIGLIGILSGIVIVAINPSLQLGKAQDAKRKSAARELEQALYQYLISSPTHDFPVTIPEGSASAKPMCKQGQTNASCVNLDALVPDYLPSLPQDSAETNTLWSGYTVYQQVGRAQVSPTHLGETGSSAAVIGTAGNPGTSCLTILSGGGSTGNGGSYWIDPDGAGAVSAFQVYCDMTTDGGGWTLVDNDADNGNIASRQAGANTNIAVTRGSYLPAYQWSATPQLMVKSSQYTGSQNWITLNALNATAREYPTQTTTVAMYSGGWSVATLNGNTNQGADAWIYLDGGHTGTVWIGNGGAPTAACDYATIYTGLGGYITNTSATCSTWVR